MSTCRALESLLSRVLNKVLTYFLSKTDKASSVPTLCPPPPSTRTCWIPSCRRMSGQMLAVWRRSDAAAGRRRLGLVHLLAVQADESPVDPERNADT